jgi:hypothetical protein
MGIGLPLPAPSPHPRVHAISSVPSPPKPRHRGLLGHIRLLRARFAPGLYYLLLQPQHQLCCPVAGVRCPGEHLGVGEGDNVGTTS